MPLSKQLVVSRVALVVAHSFCLVGFSVYFGKSTGDLHIEVTHSEGKDEVMSAFEGLPEMAFNQKSESRRTIPWIELEQAKNWHDVLGAHLEDLGLAIGVHDARERT